MFPALPLFQQFDTLAEFVPNSERGTNLLEIEYFWTIGTISVPVVAWLTLGDSSYFDSWQLFVLICALPCLASAVIAVILVPESPRLVNIACKYVERPKF